MRILGVDYGDTRTGIAISDPTGMIATGLDTIVAYTEGAVVDAISKIVVQFGVEKIILGYPKNMNGTLGVRAEKSEALKKVLEETLEIPVFLWDERLTTVSAHRTLDEANVKSKKRKHVIDKMAACLILQSYLDGAALK